MMCSIVEIEPETAAAAQNANDSAVRMVKELEQFLSVALTVVKKQDGAYWPLRYNRAGAVVVQSVLNRN